MKRRQSARDVDNDQSIAPINQRFSCSFAAETPIVRGRCSTIDRQPSQLLRAILHLLQSALDVLVGVPRLRLGVSPREEHPGWNIVDQVELVPHGECRYLVEFVSDQIVTISLVSGCPASLVVLDDDEYESWENGRPWPDPCIKTSGSLCDRELNRMAFRAARTGAYDVIVTNLGDERARVLVRITATPVGQFEPKGDVNS